MAWKQIADKNYENHLRNINYELCIAVALCFPNILDIMVLKNVNLSPLWSNDTDVDFCHRREPSSMIMNAELSAVRASVPSAV
jgi:hypothetical protein